MAPLLFQKEQPPPLITVDYGAKFELFGEIISAVVFSTLCCDSIESYYYVVNKACGIMYHLFNNNLNRRNAKKARSNTLPHLSISHSLCS